MNLSKFIHNEQNILFFVLTMRSNPTPLSSTTIDPISINSHALIELHAIT